MRMQLLVLAGAAAVTGGCGQAAEEAAGKAFDDNFRTSCVSAAQSGLSAELATKACDCALEKNNEQYTTSEKLALSDEQAQPIAMECFQKAMSANG